MATQNDAVLFLRPTAGLSGHTCHGRSVWSAGNMGCRKSVCMARGVFCRCCQISKQVSDSLEDTALKLCRKAATTAETLSQVLREGLKKRRHFKAEKISLRQERVEYHQKVPPAAHQNLCFSHGKYAGWQHAMSVCSVLAFGPPSCAEISAQRKRSLLSQKPRPQKS